MPKNSPLVWWLVLIAFGLLGVAWLILQSGTASASYPYGLVSGGMGSGMLIVLGLATRRWAKGQRASAKKSGKESSEKSTASRTASRWGCVGHVIALLWLLMGLAAAAFLVATLR
ncbi:MAG: hypothetical protein Kow00123_25090 [Anaerolineales bacterium]